MYNRTRIIVVLISIMLLAGGCAKTRIQHVVGPPLHVTMFNSPGSGITGVISLTKDYTIEEDDEVTVLSESFPVSDKININENNIIFFKLPP